MRNKSRRVWQVELDHMVRVLIDEAHEMLANSSTFSYLEMAANTERIKFTAREIERHLAERPPHEHS